MLRRLYLDNCFKHHDRTFTFDKGLTGVVGANESGKSLIVEMIRYALFGTGALRGKAEDYKSLHVELDFVVAGDAYTVVRKGTRATLKGVTHDVSGTRPVNEAIITLLGYDLTVFDVANAVNQGDVEKLTNMRPGERKAMVDQTVGLNVLDDVITFCGQEGNSLKKEAEGFMRGIVEPVAPVKPEGYVASDTLDVQGAKALSDEYIELRGSLANAPAEPVEPPACEIKEDLAELKTRQARREVLQESITNTLAKAQAIVAEKFSEEELQDMLDQWDLVGQWEAKQQLLDQGDNVCPACDHHWPLAEEQLRAFEDVEAVANPILSRKEITSAQGMCGNKQRKEDMLARITAWEDELSQLPSALDAIEVLTKHQASAVAYEAARASYDVYNQGLKKRQARFKKLEGCTETYNNLSALVAVCVQYERDLTQYETAKGQYDKNLVVYQGLVEKSQAFLESRASVQALKTQVKTHFLPALNKVASSLLHQMTGGERYSVEVDPDFEILIDHQPVHTLSGSGKAVANLAVRLALGQILTNRMFSVLLADEVDAAMDDERAEFTAGALRRLTETVGQVIQVTHKRPDTDHRIELTK